MKEYQYLGGFVYLNDTLQYSMIEGGRIRYAKKTNAITGAVYYAYEYDYFISDHMGNVRTVITEGRDTSTYKATMEPANQTVEDALFANEYTPVNTIVNKSVVPAFDSDTLNQKIAKVNGSGNKIGPSLVLKVMAGDKVQLSTYAFFNTATQPPVGGINLLTDILNVLAGGVVNNSAGKLTTTNTSAVSTALSPNVTNFLDNNRSYDNAKPKAYLNWILFDNQFNLVATNSGVKQVEPGSSKQALVAPLQNIVKSGYLYVYVSNESPQDVYFDDITIKHTTGPLMQEQAYYPYGLQIQGLSDKALMKSSMNYKYNAGSELEDEDGIGYYNTFYRKYDAQIGRFTGIDIFSEEYFAVNPYQFGADNPALFNDPAGDKININGVNSSFTASMGRLQQGPDGDYHVGWRSEQLWNDKGFFDWGNEGFGSGNYSSPSGFTSSSVLAQMSSGAKFGVNKNGQYGFWRPFDVESDIHGDGHMNLDGAAVGTRFSHLDETQRSAFALDILNKFWTTSGIIDIGKDNFKTVLMDIIKNGSVDYIRQYTSANISPSLHFREVHFKLNKNIPELEWQSGRPIFQSVSLIYSSNFKVVGLIALTTVSSGLFSGSNSRANQFNDDMWKNKVDETRGQQDANGKEWNRSHDYYDRYKFYLDLRYGIY